MSSPTRPHDDSGCRASFWSRLRILSTALVLAIGAVLVSPAVPALAGESETILSLVNRSRAAAGLGALQRNSAMDGVALAWANHLASTGKLAHNPSYSAQIPGGWSNAGENVAQGQPSGSAMHEAWMASPAHRANILGRFTDVGIAFISAGGTTWGVEVFAAYAGSAPPAQAQAPPGPGAAAPPSADTRSSASAASAASAKAAADAVAKAAADAAAQLAQQQAAKLAAQKLAEHAAVVLAEAAAERLAGRAELRRSTARAAADSSAASMKPTSAAGTLGGVALAPLAPILAGLALAGIAAVRLAGVRARRGL